MRNQYNTANKSTSKKGLIISLWIIFAALVVVLLFLLFFQRPNNAQLKEAIDNSYKIQLEDYDPDYEPHIVNKLISDRVEIEILKQTKEDVTLAITAPNMAEIIKNITSTKEYQSSKNKYEFLNNRVKNALESKNYQTVTNNVTVGIIKTDDGYTIEQTNEYADAIYGGMLSYSVSLREARTNEN